VTGGWVVPLVLLAALATVQAVVGFGAGRDLKLRPR
jgi:cyanate permease